jgi:flotillin
MGNASPFEGTEIAGLTMGGAILIGLLMFIWLMKSLLHICTPNEVLIFSGRRHRLADGSLRGFRVIVGGRGWRMPFIEKVDRMNLNVMEVPIPIRGAYSKGGIPLNVDAIANVKVSSDSRYIGNAIERFLGRDPNEIRRVAKETLEGHLRGVLARLTPEEVNEDRLKFAEELSVESEADLSKLGIHLDTFKIQHVSDEKHYLDSIGREAIANIIKDAEIAESDARRDAELAEAENQARATVMKSNVDAQVARMKNELRTIQAELEAQVRAEEERSSAAAREARAKAEQELQQIRAGLEEIRLKTDQIVPAEANRIAQEYKARGDAAILRERGYAVSQSLDLLTQAWAEAGDSALAIVLIDDIEKIIRTAGAGVARMKIGELSMIDGGDGQVLASYVASYPAMLGSMFDALAKTTGIDVPKAISGANLKAHPNGAVQEPAKTIAAPAAGEKGN